MTVMITITIATLSVTLPHVKWDDFCLPGWALWHCAFGHPVAEEEVLMVALVHKYPHPSCHWGSKRADKNLSISSIPYFEHAYANWHPSQLFPCTGVK
jgi:hypothetical protein